MARALLLIERREKSTNLAESEHYFEKAFESLRMVNHQWLMPEALLGRSEHHHLRREYNRTNDDLQETESLVNRDGLKLHGIDWRMGLVNLYLSQNQIALARYHLDLVEKEIATTGYRRRDVKVILLRAKLDHLEGQPDDVSVQLQHSQTVSEDKWGPSMGH